MSISLQRQSHTTNANANFKACLFKYWSMLFNVCGGCLILMPSVVSFLLSFPFVVSFPRFLPSNGLPGWAPQTGRRDGVVVGHRMQPTGSSAPFTEQEVWFKAPPSSGLDQWESREQLYLNSLHNALVFDLAQTKCLVWLNVWLKLG